MNLVKRIPFALASWFMLIQIVLVLIFHLLVVLEVLPLSIVWGGRLQSREELWLMESISFLINALLFWLIGQRAGWINALLKEKTLIILLRLMALLFLLNTIGNSMAVQAIERYLFGTLTLLSVIFCWRLSLER